MIFFFFFSILHCFLWFDSLGNTLHLFDPRSCSRWSHRPWLYTDTGWRRHGDMDREQWRRGEETRWEVRPGVRTAGGATRPWRAGGTPGIRRDRDKSEDIPCLIVNSVPFCLVQLIAFWWFLNSLAWSGVNHYRGCSQPFTVGTWHMLSMNQPRSN